MSLPEDEESELGPLYRIATKSRQLESPLAKQIAIRRATAIRGQARRSRKYSKPERLMIFKYTNLSQFDRAVNVYSRLRRLPLATTFRVPRMHLHRRRQLQIELRYPTFDIWDICDMMYSGGDPKIPLLKLEDIHQLKSNLLRSACFLWESNIACNVNISNLVVTRRTYPVSNFLPFLDDRHLETKTDVRKDSVEWANIKSAMIQNIEDQFRTLEVTFQCYQSLNPHRLQLRLSEIAPGSEGALGNLKGCKPISRQGNFITRHVTRYIPVLYQYVDERARKYLHFPWKADLITRPTSA
ncbi:hypothetical protein F5Y11DRAFT_267710 [Daldinia sp. FL1419]|nr:hypothetical protein F5Y11DRAFT_267710 [Daldinia sp. FL1419]